MSFEKEIAALQSDHTHKIARTSKSIKLKSKTKF